ncbi:MAG: Ig-like domain repeat protein [Anaerolineales bacterium]|nr:Ig-like domain repeat protein [Anaerolineales bacterium]
MMNQTNLKPAEKQPCRLFRLALYGLALAAFFAALLFGASLAQALPGQFLPMLISPGDSDRSPLGAAQAEPYDVTVTIDNLDPNPVMAGQPVTITASVAANLPDVGVPSGQLVIQAGQDLLCQVTLDLSGAGSCSLTFPLSGLTPIKAIYPGDSPFLPGVSDVAYLTVETQGYSEIVYQHDFETPVGDEWCLRRQETTPGGRGFLGQFSNETACLELDSLPLHQQVSVSFDLYIIRSWNGNQVSAGSSAPSGMPSETDVIVGPDRWKIEADGQLLMLTTFSNWLGHPQAYPGSYPGRDYPRFTGAVEKYTLGYMSAQGILDSVYRLTYTFAHNQDTLNLDFTAMGLQIITDESWGLDNITVRCIIPATLSSAQESIAMPETEAR